MSAMRLGVFSLMFISLLLFGCGRAATVTNTGNQLNSGAATISSGVTDGSVPAAPAKEVTLPVYRFYSGRIHDHLFSLSPTPENVDYTPEGVSFLVYQDSKPGRRLLTRCLFTGIAGKAYHYIYFDGVCGPNDIVEYNYGYVEAQPTSGLKLVQRIYKVGKLPDNTFYLDHVTTANAGEVANLISNAGYGLEPVLFYAPTP